MEAYPFPQALTYEPSVKEMGKDTWYAVILWTTPLSVKAEGISSQQEVDSSSPCNDA